MLEVLHHALYEVVDYGIIAFEIIGVAMLFWAGIKGLICVAKKGHHTGLIIGEGMALALQFLLPRRNPPDTPLPFLQGLPGF